MTFIFERDEHDNLRLVDFDSSDEPWATSKPHRRDRRKLRAVKYADSFGYHPQAKVRPFAKGA
jgi:hypothetical protein